MGIKDKKRTFQFRECPFLSKLKLTKKCSSTQLLTHKLDVVRLCLKGISRKKANEFLPRWFQLRVVMLEEVDNTCPILLSKCRSSDRYGREVSKSLEW